MMIGHLWLLCEKVLRTLIFLGVGIDLNCSYVVLYVCYLGNTFCLVMDTFLFVRFNLGVLWCTLWVLSKGGVLGILSKQGVLGVPFETKLCY